MAGPSRYLRQAARAATSRVACYYAGDFVRTKVVPAYHNSGHSEGPAVPPRGVLADDHVKRTRTQAARWREPWSVAIQLRSARTGMLPPSKSLKGTQASG